MAKLTRDLHLRIGDETWTQLRDLTRWLKLSTAAVVRRAIKELWEKHRK
jgi:hypothetical protein